MENQQSFQNPSPQNFLTGFTLLETVVALGLIVAAAIGPVALASRGVFTAKFSRSKLVALSLAEEGIEVVRHMRDNNVLANFDWRGQGSCSGSCTALPAGSHQVSVTSGSCPAISYNVLSPILLRIDLATLLYNQCSGTATPYTRVMTIQEGAFDTGVPTGSQVKIIATVSWTESGLARKVELEEVMYNWQ